MIITTAISDTNGNLLSFSLFNSEYTSGSPKVRFCQFKMSPYSSFRKSTSTSATTTAETFNSLLSFRIQITSFPTIRNYCFETVINTIYPNLFTNCEAFVAIFIQFHIFAGCLYRAAYAFGLYFVLRCH